MVDYDAAVAAVQDPNADPILLAKIAYENPEFGANVAVNPRCYPGLKRWIAEFGDDRARETLAQYGFTAEAFGGPVQDQKAPAQAALQAAEQAQQPAAQAAFEEPVATNPYGFTAEQALTTTDQMQIAQIAQYAPELRACIARNPNTYPALIEVVIILLAAFLSFKTTDAEIRRKNHFTWGAIREVAVLFIGIFITMQPALMILKAKGAELGITEPFQMFWATGFLSSFLDNTPTYLVFLTTAGSLGFTEGMQTILGTVPVAMLEAISCGAVFMGANTYIGNAPNFMVKAISDENGIKMPSFFGYLMWSIAFLVPVFLLDMLVFFL